jgi:hypothetical protein
MFVFAPVAFQNYRSITVLFLQHLRRSHSLSVFYLGQKYERLLSRAFKIFKITGEMCSLMTVTDVSDDVILSNVQSAFTKCEQRILGHCATSRSVSGSIPDGVTGIFHWHNLSGRTMTPGVDSVSNRNEYQAYFAGCKDGRCVGLTTLPHSCADCFEIWEPQSPGTLWACPGL